MNIKNWFILVIIIFILNGCNKKGVDYNIIKKDNNRAQSLRYTKRATILNSFETKAIITATFASELYSDNYKDDNDVFFIGVYIDNDFYDNDKAGLNNKEYKLTLDGKKAIDIKPVSSDDIIYKKIPFTNNWTHYYVVSYKKDNKKKDVTLIYSHDTFGKSILKFKRY